MRFFYCLIFSAHAIVLAAQERPKTYFVVVASFKASQTGYAQRLVEKLRAAGAKAGYILDPYRPYCYVYSTRYAALTESLSGMKSMRTVGGFKDAWVRILPDTVLTIHADPANPQTDKKPSATVFLAIPKEVTKPVEDAQPIRQAEIVVRPEQLALQPDSVNTNVPPMALAVEKTNVHRTLGNTQILLSLVNPTNLKIIDGEIEVIDTERARSITKVKGNSYVNLPDPKSNSGQLTLICNAFGYRKTQHEINFLNTEADTLEPHIDLVGDYYIIKFDLIRLHKGDIAVLYNVYFYNDAAIMRPESRFELNSLLSMMQENPKYKITLHGHTNGNANGQIITMGPSKDFFNFDAKDRRDGFGSAKQLSKERAEVIKEWLVSQGILSDRMVVKSWGGGRMLHDKHGAHARKNVRVEIEIIAE